MIIFAITTNVEFIDKPDWLNSFFNKHNKVLYDFHVTLKQPCIINQDQVDEIMDILSKYFKQNTPKQIDITFDKINKNASQEELSKNNGCIMIEADDNEKIKSLQKDIIEILPDYKNYLIEKTKSYEENFKPHITIATNLNEEEFESAKKDIGNNTTCRIAITEIILTIVYNYRESTEKRKESIYNLL